MKNAETDIVISLSPSKIVKIMKDPVKSAKAVSLVYTSDREADGIIRRKWGKKFVYYSGDEKIKDQEEIQRINKLAIPPAWDGSGWSTVNAFSSRSARNP